MMTNHIRANNPLISVVMPAFNAAAFLEEAVRSVMCQTVSDWELLVIDDCSRDATLEIAQRLAREDSRIRVLKNEVNMGVSRTRNRALELCTGTYVALLDSDDIWHPEKLEKQLRRMTEENADMTYCSYRIIGEDGSQVRQDYLVPGYVDFEGLLRENVIGCSTVMVRREWFRNYQFGSDLYHEDYVLWLRMLQAGCRAVGCTELLVDWRLIANSRSYNKLKSAKLRWMIYRDYLHLPMGKCIRVFSAYARASIRKYR